MRRDFWEICSFTRLYSLAIEGNKCLVEAIVFFFPFARSKIKKENHVKGLHTVKCVYLHVFFMQIAARQQKQVQEHKALYHSINSYSEEIAELWRIWVHWVYWRQLFCFTKGSRERVPMILQSRSLVPLQPFKQRWICCLQLSFQIWKIRLLEKSVALCIRSQAGFPPYQGKWK